MKSTERMADDYYESGQYRKAQELYLHLLKKRKANDRSKLRLGRIQYHLKVYSSAVQLLEQYRLKTPLAQEDLLIYANALSATGRYSQAVEVYSVYMEKYGQNDWLAMKVWRLNNLNYLYEDSLIYSISPLAINTKYSEFPVAYYNDGLLFISDRERPFKFNRHLADNTGHLTYALFYSQDLWVLDLPAGDARLKTEVSDLIPTGPYHMAGISFTPDKQKFIYARNNEANAKDRQQPLQLFSKSVSTRSKEQLLSIVKAEYSAKNPGLSPDGMQLYFAAELPEGFGGFDLYRSEWEGESWSEPVNLGSEINSPGDEGFPFMHSSGMLYFSSDGLPGFGGTDLFKVDIKNEAGEPQNLGYPINSHSDEFALILNERGDRGHFASNRKNGGLDDDIYMIEIDLQQYPLTITGLLKFKNVDSGPVILPNSTFEVVDNNNQEIIFRSKSDEKGRFSIEIPYSSQFFIRLQMGDADPLVVSLEIPKNKDKQANHEIVVVSSRYIPIHQSNNQ